MGRRATELGWVLLGKVALVACNAILMVMLAHHLKVSTYGLFVTVVGAQALVSRFVLLGVDQGMTRLRTLPDLVGNPHAVTMAGLAIILRAGAAAVCLGALAVLVVPSVGSTDLPIWAVTAILCGAIGTALFDYGCYCWLARLKYRAAGTAQGLMPLLRLLATMAVLPTAWGDARMVFLAYTTVGLSFGLVQAFVLARGQLPRLEPELGRRMLRYSVWGATTSVLGTFSTYQGVYLLGFLGAKGASGHFGLALTLSMAFYMLRFAAIDFLLPRTAMVESFSRLPRFMAKSAGVSAAVAAACVPLAIIGGVLLPYIVKPEMHAALPAFYWLSASVILLILQVPIDAAWHYLLAPQFVLWTLLLRVAAVGGLGFALAPRSGATGAAEAQFLGTLFAGACAAVMLGVKLWRAHKNSQSGSGSPPRGLAEVTQYGRP